jgi:hypothetical protein
MRGNEIEGVKVDTRQSDLPMTTTRSPTKAIGCELDAKSDRSTPDSRGTVQKPTMSIPHIAEKERRRGEV